MDCMRIERMGVPAEARGFWKDTENVVLADSGSGGKHRVDVSKFEQRAGLGAE